jgi:nitroreductase
MSKLRLVYRRAGWLYRGVLGRLRRYRARLAARMTRLTGMLSTSETLSGLYFALVPGVFGRETKAVLAGKREYFRRADARDQRYLLRRNVHMLEKGLSMRPRRGVFATAYIEETVDCYTARVDGNGACSSDLELQWANDVLSSYFEIAGDHRVINRARERFVGAPLGAGERSAEQGLAPYRRDLGRVPPVAYEDLLALAERRRSVRWFQRRPVERELIDRGLEVAGLAPSACNRQPFQFRIFDDPDLVAKIAEVPMGTRGWVHNIPTFIVIVGDLSAFFSERDRHLIYTDGCLAAMGLVFALESLGLSTCCVNWPDIREREQRMAELLDLRRYERPVMCMAVGYPDSEGMVPYSQKKPVEQIRRYNFE